MTASSSGHHCVLCESTNVKIDQAYKKNFIICNHCGFIFAEKAFQDFVIGKNIRFEVPTDFENLPAWSGPSKGGYREYYLARMLEKDLGMESFFLYGPGESPAFQNLKDEGLNIKSCDLNPILINYYWNRYGKEHFFHPETIPAEEKFDVIVAVEVFEHFQDPHYYFQMLTDHLKEGGIICGTTDFYPGGKLENDVEPGHLTPDNHIVYWSNSSMQYLAETKGMSVEAFELIRPGSVLPDAHFGILWPNKRVFFIHDSEKHGEYFAKLQKESPILPIDNP